MRQQKVLTAFAFGCFAYRVFDYYITLKLIVLFNGYLTKDLSSDGNWFSNSLTILAINGWSETAIQLLITPILSRFAWNLNQRFETLLYLILLSHCGWILCIALLSFPSPAPHDELQEGLTMVIVNSIVIGISNILYVWATGLVENDWSLCLAADEFEKIGGDTCSYSSSGGGAGIDENWLSRFLSHLQKIDLSIMLGAPFIAQLVIESNLSSQLQGILVATALALLFIIQAVLYRTCVRSSPNLKREFRLVKQENNSSSNNDKDDALIVERLKGSIACLVCESMLRLHVLDFSHPVNQAFYLYNEDDLSMKFNYWRAAGTLLSIGSSSILVKILDSFKDNVSCPNSKETRLFRLQGIACILLAIQFLVTLLFPLAMQDSLDCWTGILLCLVSTSNWTFDLIQKQIVLLNDPFNTKYRHWWNNASVWLPSLALILQYGYLTTSSCNRDTILTWTIFSGIVSFSCLILMLITGVNSIFYAKLKRE